MRSSPRQSEDNYFYHYYYIFKPLPLDSYTRSALAPYFILRWSKYTKYDNSMNLLFLLYSLWFNSILFLYSDHLVFRD